MSGRLMRRPQVGAVRESSPPKQKSSPSVTPERSSPGNRRQGPAPSSTPRAPQRRPPGSGGSTSSTAASPLDKQATPRQTGVAKAKSVRAGSPRLRRPVGSKIASRTSPPGREPAVPVEPVAAIDDTFSDMPLTLPEAPSMMVMESIERTDAEMKRQVSSEGSQSVVRVSEGDPEILGSDNLERFSQSVFKGARLWETLSTVNVRSQKSFQAEILCRKQEGCRVRGVEDEGWVRLVGEPGYITIRAFGNPHGEHFLRVVDETSDLESSTEVAPATPRKMISHDVWEGLHSPESSEPSSPEIDMRQTKLEPTNRPSVLRHANTDSQDNIKVCVRVRPLSVVELSEGEVDCVHLNSRPAVSSAQSIAEFSDGSVTIVPPGLAENRLGSLPSARDGHASRRTATDFFEESTREKPVHFAFDWVIPGEAGQRTVYDLLGERVVQGVADGFHGCFFAYGQTGSGKSHTIFGGAGDDRGLLLRISERLFEVLHQAEIEHIVKLSYLEIYNEKIRDLLRPMTEKDVNRPEDLPIRHHPKVGVFVEGLMNNVVQSPEDVARLLDYGHVNRAVGRTNMNAASSRSHAVVTLNVEEQCLVSQARSEHAEEPSTPPAKLVRRRACLHSVDLAGSERLSMAGNVQIRQQESKKINKSLWALSLMISRLATQEQLSNSASTSSLHIPYRNSKLTYILSNSLMGNCKTVMLACVSPASSSFRFTESTLRFAASAKKIRTRPVKNEELDGDLVCSLRAEIEQLRLQLNQVGNEKKKDIQEQLATTQLLHKELGSSWEEQQAQAVAYENERCVALQSLGLSSGGLAAAWKRGESSLHLVKPDAEPYLVNVCDDPLLSGCLTYMLPRGEHVVVGSDPSCEIQINGLGVLPQMCDLICNDGRTVQVSRIKSGQHEKSIVCRKTMKRSGTLEIDAGSDGSRRGSFTYPQGSLFKKGVGQVFVNNELVQKTSTLQHAERLRIGHAHVFQLFVPQQVKDKAHGRRQTLNDFIESGTDSIGEQILAKEYHAHLKERVGPERASKVFKRLKELRPLIEEANEITDELRGDEAFEMVFKAHVLTDITSTSEDPEIAIVMRVTEKPDEITEDGSLFFLHGQHAHCSTIVWSIPKFMHRLEVMRDLYEDVSMREATWGQLDDWDPWNDDLVRIGDADATKHVHQSSLGAPQTPLDTRKLDPAPGGCLHRHPPGGNLPNTSANFPSADASAAETSKTIRNGSSIEPDAEPADETDQLLRLPLLEAALHNALTSLAAKEVELQQASSKRVQLEAALVAKDRELQRLANELEKRSTTGAHEALAGQPALTGCSHIGASASGASAGAVVGFAAGAMRGRPGSARAAQERVGSAGRSQSWGSIGTASREHVGSAASFGSFGAAVGAVPGSFVCGDFERMGSVGSIGSVSRSGNPAFGAAVSGVPPHSVAVSSDAMRVLSAALWPAPSSGHFTQGLPSMPMVPTCQDSPISTPLRGGSARAPTGSMHQISPMPSSAHSGATTVPTLPPGLASRSPSPARHNAPLPRMLSAPWAVPPMPTFSSTPMHGQNLPETARPLAAPAAQNLAASSGTGRMAQVVPGCNLVARQISAPAQGSRLPVHERSRPTARATSRGAVSTQRRPRSADGRMIGPMRSGTPSVERLPVPTWTTVQSGERSAQTQSAEQIALESAVKRNQRAEVVTSYAQSAEQIALEFAAKRNQSADVVTPYLPARAQSDRSAERLAVSGQPRIRSTEDLEVIARPGSATVSRGVRGRGKVQYPQELRSELGDLGQQLIALHEFADVMCDPLIVQPASSAAAASTSTSSLVVPSRQSVVSTTYSGDACSC